MLAQNLPLSKKMKDQVDISAAQKKLLLVDDETAILLAFKKILEKPGISVDTAATSEEALALVNNEKYDVAIVDLRLTGVLGKEGLNIIQQIKNIRPETCLILVTGYGYPEVMQEAFRIGVDFYFEKPVPIDVLRNALRSLGI